MTTYKTTSNGASMFNIEGFNSIPVMNLKNPQKAANRISIIADEAAEAYEILKSHKLLDESGKEISASVNAIGINANGDVVVIVNNVNMLKYVTVTVDDGNVMIKEGGASNHTAFTGNDLYEGLKALNQDRVGSWLFQVAAYKAI